MIKWSADAEFDAQFISLDDHGATVGDGIFESMRVTKLGVFALERHLKRLRYAAKIIDLDLPSEQTIKTAIEAVIAELKQREVADARMRLTITSGVGPAGVMRGANINWFVTAAPLSKPTGSARLISSNIVRNELSPLVGIKTISYLENVVALNQAVKAGFDEALIYNTKNEVVETATCNLIFELDHQLITPAAISGPLLGITREIAISEFGVDERVLKKSDLANISGAALLSSVRGIQHISQIDDLGIAGSSKIAELTLKYQEILASPTYY